MSIEDIERYVREGWVLYDVSTKEAMGKHGIKYLVLANPNHPE